MPPSCGCDRHLPAGVSRRDVLRLGMAAAGLVALGPFRRWAPPVHGSPLPVTRLVVINLFGGNDTLNMVVPHALAPYHERRPGLAIDADLLLRLDSGPASTSTYRLHPTLTRTQGLWQEGAVAAVQRVGYPDANLSHFTSQDIFSLGVRDRYTAFAGASPSGWIARYADLYAPTPLGAVSVGVGRPLDFVGGTSAPLLVGSLAGFKLNGSPTDTRHLHRLDAAKKVLQRFSGKGNSAEARTALLQSHDLTTQVQGALTAYSSSVGYPSTTLGRRLKDVAVLIQGGFETRIFFTGYGGFDTHGAQGQASGTQPTLLAELDGALGAFTDDLKAMGVWEKTVIIVLTEFGRRNYVNGSEGTDHGHGFCELLVGGAVNGGTYGPDLGDADLLGEYPEYAVDFRAIYKEVLRDHLGADPAPVFPEPLETETDLGLI